MEGESNSQIFHDIQGFLRRERDPQLPKTRLPIGNYFNQLRIKATDISDGWQVHTRWAMIQIQGTINWQGRDRLVVDREYYQELLDDENTLASGELLTGVIFLGITRIVKNPLFRTLTLLGGIVLMGTAYAHHRNVQHAQKLLDNAQIGDDE